ncbi:tyrosine-protein kinase [Chryseolinea sp. H1M3-3]|uniref:exopolysaccharide transport family protein n=1 Tax=Chryseolinea sp. H1M3-3 TaxID=3034144 RepID=UPI0023EBBE77|nr:tyrosine-protein kinase [Chryseolinea sp. H1M3-3]
MDGKINIKEIILKLLSKWYYFLIAMFIVIPLAYAYLKFTPKQYQVRASLLLKSEDPNAMSSEQFLKGMDLFTPKTELEDEIGILKSYSMVEQAMRQLDFAVAYYTKKNFVETERYEDSPFTIQLDSAVDQFIYLPIYIERISSTKFRVTASGKKVSAYNYVTNTVESLVEKVEINEEGSVDKPFVTKNLSFTIKFNDQFKPDKDTQMFFVLNTLGSLVEGYQGKLGIEPIALESNIVELGVKGRVVEKEIRFLDKLLEVYLENELYKKNQLGLKTIQFIDNQLAGVSDTLRQVEGSLEHFRSRNNILDVNSTANNLTANLDKLEEDKADLEVKLKYYTFLANTLKKESDISDIVVPSALGLDDPLLNNLLLELSKLYQERTGYNYNAKENNPLIEIVDMKIRNSKKSISENVSNMIEVTAIALTDVNNRIFKIQKNLNALPKNERELVKIQRSFEFNDNVYNYLLEKRAEAGIAIASNSIQKTIVDRPYQVGSGPVSPNSKVIYGLALFVGLAGTIAFIVIKDFLNDNIVTHEDVERNTKIPFIGAITHGNKREQGTIIAHARSPIGESFRSLRVNLQYLTLGKNANVIGITSSRESEGKTFCSVNLAAAMAHSGRKTILIDTDMRRPKVASYFQLKNKKGLSNFLIGDCSIKEIINPTESKGFDVIGSGPIPPNPIDLIGHPRMEELINTLKQNYSTIILDSPPLGYVSEYIILMKYTDANIYVVRSDYTHRNSLSKINKLYERKKISNVSILLNDVKTSKRTGYGYGYEYKF